MDKWLVVAVGVVVAVLAACGVPTSQEWTSQEVIKTVKDELQTTLLIERKRSDQEADVLSDPSNEAGYYNIWVFKPGSEPSDYDIGGVPVPPHGVLSWGKWKPLDPEDLPGEGTHTVLRTYGNVVLDYFVDGKKGAPRPELPKGFIRLDSALTALDGYRGESVSESTTATEDGS